MTIQVILSKKLAVNFLKAVLLHVDEKNVFDNEIS